MPNSIITQANDNNNVFPPPLLSPPFHLPRVCPLSIDNQILILILILTHYRQVFVEAAIDLWKSQMLLIIRFE